VASAKLYVGNLSYEMSEASLRSLFEQHGEVTSVTLMISPGSQRSRGFGFVEMATTAQAQTAKSALDGAHLEGRSLTVELVSD
jgi:cold-inducible RNA-binding protein